MTDIGIEYYLAALAMAFVTYAVCFRITRRRNRMHSQNRRIAVSALVPYLFLVLASTIITRRPGEAMHYKLQPFWTYREIHKYGYYGTLLPTEILLNIFMLMPLGFLMPFIIRPCSRGMSFIKSFLAGAGVSLFIELVQLITRRGLFEFDDVIHNTFGVLIGWLVAVSLNKVVIRSR